MPITQHRRLARRMQPIGVNQRMLRGRNDFYILQPRIRQTASDKFRRPIHIFLIFRQRANARYPQKLEQLGKQTILVLLDKRGGGGGHDSIIRRPSKKKGAGTNADPIHKETPRYFAGALFEAFAVEAFLFATLDEFAVFAVVALVDFLAFLVVLVVEVCGVAGALEGGVL
jgi:hypothetical protein